LSARALGTFCLSLLACWSHVMEWIKPFPQMCLVPDTPIQLSFLRWDKKHVDWRNVPADNCTYTCVHNIICCTLHRMPKQKMKCTSFSWVYLNQCSTIVESLNQPLSSSHCQLSKAYESWL
jgi:hypothetical protein